MTEVRVKIFLFSQRNLFPRFIIAFRPEEPKRKIGFLSFRNLTRQLINSREKKNSVCCFGGKRKKQQKSVHYFFFFFKNVSRSLKEMFRSKNASSFQGKKKL